MDRRVLRDRIQRSIAVDANGCWIWQKAIDRDGYGKTSSPVGRIAHRVAYVAFKREIRDGYQIDHLCRVRSCVNPAHLQAVTARTNVLRSEGLAARNAAKTHCSNGHPFNKVNTKMTAAGRRKCRACNATNTWPGAA